MGSWEELTWGARKSGNMKKGQFLLILSSFFTVESRPRPHYPRLGDRLSSGKGKWRMMKTCVSERSYCTFTVDDQMKVGECVEAEEVCWNIGYMWVEEEEGNDLNKGELEEEVFTDIIQFPEEDDASKFIGEGKEEPTFSMDIAVDSLIEEMMIEEEELASEMVEFPNALIPTLSNLPGLTEEPVQENIVVSIITEDPEQIDETEIFEEKNSKSMKKIDTFEENFDKDIVAKNGFVETEENILNDNVVEEFTYLEPKLEVPVETIEQNIIEKAVEKMVTSSGMQTNELTTEIAESDDSSKSTTQMIETVTTAETILDTVQEITEPEAEVSGETVTEFVTLAEEISNEEPKVMTNSGEQTVELKSEITALTDDKLEDSSKSTNENKDIETVTVVDMPDTLQSIPENELVAETTEEIKDVVKITEEPSELRVITNEEVTSVTENKGDDFGDVLETIDENEAEVEAIKEETDENKTANSDIFKIDKQISNLEPEQEVTVEIKENSDENNMDIAITTEELPEGEPKLEVPVESTDEQNNADEALENSDEATLLKDVGTLEMSVDILDTTENGQEKEASTDTSKVDVDVTVTVKPEIVKATEVREESPVKNLKSTSDGITSEIDDIAQVKMEMEIVESSSSDEKETNIETSTKTDEEVEDPIVTTKNNVAVIEESTTIQPEILETLFKEIEAEETAATTMNIVEKDFANSEDVMLTDEEKMTDVKEEDISEVKDVKPQEIDEDTLTMDTEMTVFGENVAALKAGEENLNVLEVLNENSKQIAVVSTSTKLVEPKELTTELPEIVTKAATEEADVEAQLVQETTAPTFLFKLLKEKFSQP